MNQSFHVQLQTYNDYHHYLYFGSHVLEFFYSIHFGNAIAFPSSPPSPSLSSFALVLFTIFTNSLSLWSLFPFSSILISSNSFCGVLLISLITSSSLMFPPGVSFTAATISSSLCSCC
eukprot:710137_1